MTNQELREFEAAIHRDCEWSLGQTCATHQMPRHPICPFALRVALQRAADVANAARRLTDVLRGPDWKHDVEEACEATEAALLLFDAAKRPEVTK